MPMLMGTVPPVEDDEHDLSTNGIMVVHLWVPALMLDHADHSETIVLIEERRKSFWLCVREHGSCSIPRSTFLDITIRHNFRCWGREMSGAQEFCGVL